MAASIAGVRSSGFTSPALRVGPGQPRPAERGSRHQHHHHSRRTACPRRIQLRLAADEQPHRDRYRQERQRQTEADDTGAAQQSGDLNDDDADAEGDDRVHAALGEDPFL